MACAVEKLGLTDSPELFFHYCGRPNYFEKLFI